MSENCKNIDKIDIVSLIENNPINRLNIIYKNKFIERLKSKFNNFEQQLFLASFYCYLNYDKENDYVIELNNVWRWLGFSRIDHCKTVLEKHFIKDTDYKIVFPQLRENLTEIKNQGGRPKETILLNIKTFKKLCLKSNTKKADEIHDYFIMLEELLQQILFEEAEEKQIQLEEQQKLIESQGNELEKKEILLKRKERQLKEMTKKTSLDYIYVAVNEGVSNLSKIGITENIIKRNDNHLSSNPGFKYVFTYQSKNNKLIEACVKNVLSPFVYNKAEWFSVDSKDLVFIVEFFIDMFDRNNGTEDCKNIVDFINRLRSRNIIQRNVNELIPKELYDDFFKEHIEIDEHPKPQHGFNKKEYKYKCTLVRLQQKLDEWLRENNYKIQIRNGNDNYSMAYKMDILNYIKTRFNKELDTITIIDKKNNINLSSYLGFTGFRMKCDFDKTFFDNHVYKNFIESHLQKENNFRITTKEILEIFGEWLKKNNIQSNMSIYTNDEFSYVFRQEFTNAIENIMGVKVSKKVSSKKYHGYVGFVGLKIKN